MSVVAFASISGAPGVTSAAFAAAVHWPRPVLLVEADTANVGSAMTGFFRSNLTLNAGMHQISLAQSRGVLGIDLMLDPSVGISIAVHDLPPIDSMPIPALLPNHRLWVIPGYRDLQTIDGVQAVWKRLPHLFAQLHERGIDVIVDLGRLGRDDVRLPILDGANQVVFVASTTMTDLNRLHKRIRLDDLAERIAGLGHSKYSLLLTRAPVESVDPDDFARSILPVLGTVAFDPEGSAVFSHGREDRRPQRNRYRHYVRKAVVALNDRIAAEAATMGRAV